MCQANSGTGQNHIGLDLPRPDNKDNGPVRSASLAVPRQATTSVVMPVLNGEDFILDALASALKQLDRDDEVLVIDDRSTDGTRALLQDCDVRVKLLDGTGDGPSAARNVGLAEARGDFIAFLDHDDLWPEGRHAAMLTALLAKPQANAVAGRIRIRVDEGGSPGDYLTLDGLHAPSLIWSCLYRRDLVERAGSFDEDMRFGEDLSYYLRLADSGMKIIHCEHDAIVYRRHANNATNAAPPRNSGLLQILAKRVARARGD